MALVSPGISITINDQSQYVQTNVGSVPLVILATEQDKTYNGLPATGTSKTNAGKLQSFTSQRDLVTAFGTPKFQVSSAGTPINGSELNEYGLMAAYSALGLGNQLYAIRADVDLKQLKGTSVRPIGDKADGTLWLDLVNTEFGQYAWNATTGTFNHISPMLITDSNKVVNDGSFSPVVVATPKGSVGNVGTYAMVFVNADGTTPSNIRTFYKATAGAYTGLSSTWVQVGSANWQKCFPTVTGTTTTSISSDGSTNNKFTINGTVVQLTSGTKTPADIATAINGASITGVTAKADATTNNFLTIYCTSAAASGRLVIADGGSSGVNPVGLASIGLIAGTYLPPTFQYGAFTQQPSWLSTDPIATVNGTLNGPRPTGSFWWKTSATGVGFSPALKSYSASLDTWATVSCPMYTSYGSANAGLDPVGGGVNIAHGQIIATYGLVDATSNVLRFARQRPASITTATSGQPASTVTGTFSIAASSPGVSGLTTPVNIVLSSATPDDIVTAILAAQVPYVTAIKNVNTTITIQHSGGGQITLANVSGTPLATMGFVAGQGTGFIANPVTGSVTISNWDPITTTITYSTTTPYASPASGSLWYYSNPADVDIMINDNGWKGYKVPTVDARGYPLYNTDPLGVIVSTTPPKSQSDGGALKAGQLWLDSSDLVHYPALYRTSTGGTDPVWVKIDNSDQTSSNGIVFADVRWDTDGTTDPISGNLPDITALLSSNYIDLDAPDWRLYPRGILLFNTRRSGFNVKKFVNNYFNPLSFPPVTGTNPANYPSATPSITNAWISDSGLNADGSMKAGQAAQRGIVIAAMQSALDSNIDVREDNYRFNLMAAPGYPELIPNMVTLNDDRGDTAFIIGDTPMTLSPNSITLNAWSNNTNGTGLATASAYLGVYYPAGRTNDLSGNQVVVPASHAVLRTYMYNDNVSYPWFAPAGTHRGLVDNLSDIGYLDANSGAFIHNGISQGTRDVLYQLNINPVTQLPGTGLVVWGQETRSGTSTARDRVNVVRLENYLRVIFKSISNGFLFEPNDTTTRKTIATQIESALHDVLSKRGLTDFLVICDSSNNTSSTIANNQLYVDVAIEPMRDVEFIYIPIAIYNPGVIAGLGLAST
jgi:Phage tail sheath C-terminal domain